MTHKGVIMAKWVMGVDGYEMDDVGFPVTYKKLSHGSQVLPKPNICLFAICTDGDKHTELDANPDITLITYEEIVEEVI